MRQAIRSLYSDEIEELSLNGGRVVQVISHKPERRPRKPGDSRYGELEEIYTCLVEEKEETVNEIESVEYLDDENLIIHFKDKMKIPRIIPIKAPTEGSKEGE